MTYELGFLDSALKEWRKLDANIREQFKKKLAERLEAPRVPSAKLSGSNDRYKIKLRHVGYRLVYEVHATEVIVIVVAVGRRDRNAAYWKADKRRDKRDAIMNVQKARAERPDSSPKPALAKVTTARQIEANSPHKRDRSCSGVMETQI